MPNYGHLSLSCTKIERPSLLEKPPCKVRFFANRYSRKYRQKVTVTTLFQTTSHRTFSTSHTNAPRSLSRVKAGTHSALLKESHTTAHTAKQGHSLPRPQCGFALPVNSFLFRHAFIYIHFPVHCEPPLSAERKIRRNCRHKFYPQPFLIPVFNFSHKRPTFVSLPKASTHSAPLKESHTTAHTAKQGPSGQGRYHYPRSVPHVHKYPRAGCQSGVLCRFGILAGRFSRRTQKAFGTAMRLCVSLSRRRRGPAGLRCSVCNLVMLLFFHSVRSTF